MRLNCCPDNLTIHPAEQPKTGPKPAQITGLFNPCNMGQIWGGYGGGSRYQRQRPLFIGPIKESCTAAADHTTPQERTERPQSGFYMPVKEICTRCRKRPAKRQNKQNNNGRTTGKSGSRNKTNRPPVAISKSISKSLQAADMDKLSGQQEAQKPNGSSQNIKCTRSASFY